MTRIGSTLLARLSSGFRGSEEVLATRALWLILTAHESAKNAFLRLLKRAGLPPHFAQSLAIREEHDVEEHGRIDLVGQLPDGGLAFALEAKWTRTKLRQNQTGGYLSRVKPGGILLYVVPEARLEELTSEIADAFHLGCVAGEKGLHVLRHVTASQAGIAVTSWKHLLNLLVHDCTGMAVEDIRQLQGLCDSISPLEYEPFAYGWDSDPARQGVAQAVHLAPLILARAEKEFALTNVFLAAEETTSIGWYFDGVPWYGWFGFEPTAWAFYGQSPLWIAIPLQKQHHSLTDAAAAEWRKRTGKALIRHRYTTDHFLVPIMLTPGRTQEMVIDSALTQFREVAECYAAAETASRAEGERPQASQKA